MSRLINEPVTVHLGKAIPEVAEGNDKAVPGFLRRTPYWMLAHFGVKLVGCA
jgi:hypothetical protein